MPAHPITSLTSKVFKNELHRWKYPRLRLFFLKVDTKVYFLNTVTIMYGQKKPWLGCEPNITTCKQTWIKK